MWQSFLVAFGAVVPFVIYLTLGWGIVKSGLTDRAFMNTLNKVAFKLFFPVLMFKNVYAATPEGMPSLKLIALSVAGILTLICLLMLIVPRIVKQNPRRGVIIQGIFRSNLILYGVPLTSFVFGSAGESITGIMVLIMVSIFNVSAVVVLESFNGGGKRMGFLPLLLRLVKNPLLQGCVFGLAFFALGIRLPKFLETPVNALGNLASPIAMITLGGTLRFAAMGENRRALSWVLAFRLVIVPLVMLVIGRFIGLGNVELFLVLVIFGTPTAVSSYPMAQNMGGDGELAGQIVFLSTLLSLVTIFLFIFALGQLNLLV